MKNNGLVKNVYEHNLTTQDKIIEITAKKIFILVLSIQLALFGIISLDKLIMPIPILRQVIGFIYIIFVPGITLLSIIRLHKLNIVEFVLYSVGSSLAFLMLTGFLMNTLYPVIGISRPLSSSNLIITISGIILILCFVIYFRNKSLFISSSINKKNTFSLYSVSLILVLFLSFFGAYMLNIHDSNILLLIFLLIIGLLAPIIIFSRDRLLENSYPFVVFVIALSLLYHSTLSSNYLYGADIHISYYFANLVKINLHWDRSIYNPINSMLGIVMLGSIFSNMSGMSLTWVFKIIYPFVYSLVPVGLYQLFRKQTNGRIAFLSCFYFMAPLIFYTTMTQIVKQMIAEFFLVLVMLVLVNNENKDLKKTLLLLIFSFSMIVSHYGISYFFMISLIIVGVLSFILPLKREKGSVSITHKYISFFIVSTLTWYIFTAGHSNFSNIVFIGEHVASSLFELSRSPTSYYVTTPIPLYDQILRLFFLITQFLVLIGFLNLLYYMLRRQKNGIIKFYDEYILFCIVCMAFLLAFTIISGSERKQASIFIDLGRVYHITLLFLSPLCIIGAKVFIDTFKKIFTLHLYDNRKNEEKILRIFSIFLAIFFLLNSHFIEVVTMQHSIFILPVDKPVVEVYGNTKKEARLYSSYVQEQDVYSTKWLSEKGDNRLEIYCDSPCLWLVSYGGIPLHKLKELSSNTDVDGYIYLKYLNYAKDIMVEGLFERFLKTSDILPNLDNYKDKIYTNGGSVIYK